MLSLTSRTARCIDDSPSIAMGRAFATQVLAVPIGEEIESMSPEVVDDDGADVPEHAAASLPFRG